MDERSLVSSQRKKSAPEISQMSQPLSFQAMQASTSLQPAFPSGQLSGTPDQLGQHALSIPGNCQPQMLYSYNPATIERPDYGLGSQSLSIDPGLGGGHTTEQSSSLHPPPNFPYGTNNIGSSSSLCIASRGMQCYCYNCTSAAKNTPTAWDINTSTSNHDTAQNYNPFREHNLYTTNSSGGFRQDSLGLNYSNTVNNGSHLAQVPYGSALNTSRDSGFSFDPTLGPGSSSVGLPGGSYGHNSRSGDMRGPRTNASQQGAKPHDSRHQQYRERGQARRLPRGPSFNEPNKAPIASLERDIFLEAQRILQKRKSLSNAQKESLANLLEITTEQLDSCIEVKRTLEPTLNDLCSKSQICGIPNDYIVGWFQQVQSSHTPDKGPLHDSAYQSFDPSLPKNSEPPPKRRKIARSPSSQRTFQCTHIKHDRTFCLQESSNFTDWKRHEETHCPQRRWECLLQGFSPNTTCHFCGHHISPDISQFHLNHARCLGQNPRKGHDFPRKDKLVNHTKTDHDFSSNLEAWQYPTPTSWKPQCGFCGETFTNWDTRCDRVGKHFTEGKRMIPDWRDPWPVEEAADAPDEDNDQGGDGDGDDHNNGSYDKDADGEDDPDNGPEPGSGNHGTNGQGNPSRTSKGADNQQDRGSGRTHNSGNGKHEGNQRGRQAHNWNCEPVLMHQSLSLRPSRKVRGPMGDDNIFKSIGQLGYGTFGYVDEVQHAVTKVHFARKTVRVIHHLQAQREVIALRRLKHVHIVDLAASYTFEDQFSIIISPVAEGSLCDYMVQDASPPLERTSNLSKWVGCLVSAVAYMHDMSCQHLDIKPSNILIAGGQVMLSDFGGAVISDGSTSINISGNGCAITPMYCAPEIADQQATSFVAGASDVYSLGCVLLEMATVIRRESLPTFENFRGFGSKNASYHRNYQKSLIWIDHLRDIDGNLGFPLKGGVEIIRNMLSTDWTKRPSARGIEQSLHLWHLQSICESEKRNHLIIAQTDESKTEKAFDALAVVRRWLHNCLSSHTCTISNGTFSPSRILNVGIDGDNIRLESGNPSIPYVALSYCWGSTTPLRTTSQTLGTMLKNIPMSALSNTFSNAVRITRALGFHYLWIDALCIVQDSREDWTTQVSQMHKIYSQSTLTICITNETKGSVTSKPKLLAKSNVGRVASPCSTCKNGYKVFKPLVDDTVTTMLLDSQWSRRAWTLQERILSPRIIYYSADRIAWECDGERSTLDRVSQIRENLKLLGIGHNLSNNQEGNPAHLLPRSFRKTWRDIIQEFSRRHLSFEEDKLPALSGIAYAMAATSRQSYVAGLWKEHLINDLLWCRDFPTIPLPRPNYRAPSWSWASIDSPIVWSKAVNGPLDKNAHVLDCQTEVISNSAPFAGVSNGHLLIEGLTRDVVVISSRPEEILDRINLQPLAFAQWDTGDVQTHSSPDPRLKGPHIEELFCVQILSEVGLVLREITRGESQTFQRVGIYWNQMEDGSRPISDESWKVRSLTII